MLVDIILYLIVILFPILLNLFFVTYKKNIKEKESSTFLNFSLLLSLYFSIKYFNLIHINYLYIFSTIPILLSFIYKKPIISIILILIFLENYFYITTNNYIAILFLITSYYILYFFYVNNKFNKKLYAFIFSVLSVLFVILKLILSGTSLNLQIYLIFLSYFISIYFTITFIIKANEVINIFMSFKEIEKENIIKVSLFKITHEIKNPLAVVKGYLDMFDLKDKIKSERYLNIVKNEIKRTLNLLNDLNDFNKIRINKSLTDFNKLLDDMKDVFIPYFKENKIDYTFKAKGDINVLIDSERIKQVLINIIKNSVEASTNGCKINFISFLDSNKLYIFVKDNAAGMSKETIENLFTPFYTTKEYGTGLGLCLSKEIVEAHNGTINYTSTINKGTTVKIVIPIN